MAQLHKALESLRPTKWADVPVDDLTTYLHNSFAEAEFIINSVPPLPGGDDFSHAHRTRMEITGATKASEMVSSQARPPPVDAEMQELAKAWGKPMKLGAKDNPLGVDIHKMAGNDRHGAWFARRSIHEGLGFSKWKKAMQKEFPESLAVQTGPGAGSVRGIGGDRRLARHDVEGVGRAEVYELSAKFPAPTAPRDFVTLLLTSDSALSEKSALHIEGGNKVIPRHWIVVSIPCEHPDAPVRQGLVRGTYESVEIIREIPLNPPKSQSTPDLLSTGRPDMSGRPRSSTSGEALGRNVAGDDAELNPIEWIMVTRSDPGGGIPRFLVDRGTPPSIAADTVKFLDWACARDDASPLVEDAADSPTPEADHEGRRESYSSLNSRLVAGVDGPSPESVEASTESLPIYPTSTHQSGVIGQFGATIGQFGTTISQHFQALEEQANRYTPDIVQQQFPTVFPREKAGVKEDVESSDTDSSDTSSLDSFASAEPYYTAESHIHDGTGDATPIGSPIPTTSHHSPSSSLSDKTKSQTSLSSADKELARIDAKKRSLDAKLAASRTKREKETQKAQAKSAEEQDKQRERHERDMLKRQERHDREMRKLEERARKEERKAEARKRKELEKDTLARTQRERDDTRLRVGVLEEENKVLRTQLGDLQRENTKLVAKLGAIEDGQRVLKQVRDELGQEGTGKRRATSVGSTGSKCSGDLRGRGTEKEVH